MKRRVVGLVVLMIAFGVGYARSVQRSDGYLHDEPCCFGDMGVPVLLAGIPPSLPVGGRCVLSSHRA